MRIRFIVVQKRDGAPVETFPFEEYWPAFHFYEQLSANWSETYFCQVVVGPRDAT